MSIREKLFGRALTKAEFENAVFWPRWKQAPPVHVALFGTIVAALLLIVVAGGPLWMEAWDPKSGGKVSLTVAALVTPLAAMIGAMFKFTENMFKVMRESDNTHVAAKGVADAAVAAATKAQPDTIAAPPSPVSITTVAPPKAAKRGKP